MIFRIYPGFDPPGYRGPTSDRAATKGEYGFVTIALTVCGILMAIASPSTLYFTIPLVAFGCYKYITTD